jgi:hypothetical protein
MARSITARSRRALVCVALLATTGCHGDEPCGPLTIQCKEEGRCSLAVSTWYVLGSDGRPWDGAIDPKQTLRVNVIGYLDEPLAPGALATATVDFAGSSFPVQSVAGAHWR